MIASTQDEKNISAVYLPNPSAKFTILYSHGNAEDIGDLRPWLETLQKAKKPLPEIIDELYLVTLSRSPRPDEIERARHWISMAPSHREGLQDVLWALLNSKEFLFNR